MAAHMVYHGSDSLPSSFPAPRPTARNHMMSEYEAPIIMQPSVPHPEVENSLEVTFDEELPTFRKPSPTHHQFDFADLYDPTLCVTPEKSSFRRTDRSDTQLQNLNRGSDIGVSLKPSHSQKVRFENFVEVKEMTPEGATSTQQVAQQTSSKGPVLIEKEPVVSSGALFDDLEPFGGNETDSSGAGNSLEGVHRKCQEIGHSHSSNVSLSGSSDINTTDDVEIVSVLASDVNRKVKINKAKKSNPHQPKQDKKEKCSGARPKERNDTKSPVDATSKFSEPVEHVLARPEFNSTLRVSKELQQVSNAQLNVEAAVKQRLQNSRKTKDTIKEKVANRVNAAGPLYSSLVSVDVQEADLIGAVERGKSSKVRTTSAGKTSKHEESLVSPPDILDCFSPNLIRESASYALEGLPSAKNEPQLAHHERAFDVFRHVRSWEKW